VGREGSFTLYCTVANKDEGAEGRYKYGEVPIKLHEVTESKIMGEAFFNDTDGDGFSDSWETAHENEGFNPEDPADGGPVYVSSAAIDDNGWGTETRPYRTLAKGVEKAKAGLTEEARTVVVLGTLTRKTGNSGSDTSVICITDTGLHGVTVTGRPSAHIDAERSSVSRKRALYLGPGTRLTLKNITIQNGWALRGGGVYVDGAELTLGEGAVIRGCWTDAGSSSGTGIHAFGGASVIMESGSLIGGDTPADANEGLIGAGVALLNGSSLTMKGGSSIRGNHFGRGAAVAADLRSLVTLEPGAEIRDNSNYSTDDAVTHGGGVRLTGGSRLLMKGGRIAGNTLSKGNGGGGVYVGPESVLEMKGGEIRGNDVGASAAGVKGNGGGVYVDAGSVFSMTGGEIAENTAAGKGGGVYVDRGSFAKIGGAIYGSGDAMTNTAETGKALFTTNPDRSEDGTLLGSVTL
jgi:hypothetical protein